jgi:hypothetical protein
VIARYRSNSYTMWRRRSEVIGEGFWEYGF